MSSKNDKKSQKNKEEKEFVDVRIQWYPGHMILGTHPIIKKA